MRGQLKQLQYEHDQLLSLSGEQTGNEKQDELQAEAGYELGLRQPRQIAEEKPVNESEVEGTRHEEIGSPSEDLVQDMRTLEKEISTCNCKLEKETVELKTEQENHERLNSEIRSCQQRTGYGTRLRELKKNIEETKVLVDRLRAENTNLAGYILRKRKQKLVGRYVVVLNVDF